MPLYEYRCGDCQKISSVLVRLTSEDSQEKQPSCEHCQSTDMKRLISKFSFRASWGDSLNWAPSGETMRDVDEGSPASIDNYMGRIKKEMGGQTTSDFDRERRDINNA
ncbi:MAG: zinc ribbon domain-containing protein [Chloroflexi bacterium]|nr:zinc ribbon domain-containing protein [Chloroflexota bacterium]